jgi:hypothetical protein
MNLPLAGLGGPDKSSGEGGEGDRDVRGDRFCIAHGPISIELPSLEISEAEVSSCPRTQEAVSERLTVEQERPGGGVRAGVDAAYICSAERMVRDRYNFELLRWCG